MTNAFYNSTGEPGTGAFAASAPMRSEFLDIQAAFDKMPLLTAGTAIVVNGAGTALANTVGRLALAGNFTTTGAFNLTLTVPATVNLTTPLVDGTLATLAGTETLSNKTLVAPALGTPVSGVATNLTGLPLATGVTGNLGVSNGGTGVATFVANGVLYGGATVGSTAAGTTGQVLTGNTGSAPTWATLSGSAVTTISFGTTGLTPSSATAGAITVAGTLAVANGGTGVVTSTGSGSVVLSTSPTLTTPTLVTPALGVATATSLAIGGAALGAGQTLAITGNATLSGGSASSTLLTLISASANMSINAQNSVNALGFLQYESGNRWQFYVANASVGSMNAGGAWVAPSSVAIGGATIGSNGLAVTGTALFNSAVTNASTTTLSAALTYGGVTLSNAVTGTGSMVLSSSPTIASPTLTTPVLGVATATTLAIGGAAIGTNALAVTGNATFSAKAAFGGTTFDPFGRFYSNLISVSSGATAAIEINAATGNSAFLDLGVNSVRAGGLNSDGTSIAFQTTGTSIQVILGVNGQNDLTIANGGVTGIRGSLAIGGATIGANALAVTGTALLSGATTMSAALTYGGVTLSNSVTGTGSMVLSASPTFTGSPLAPTQAAANNSTAVSTTAYADRIGVQQTVSTITGAVASGATTIPFDDTIPQNTEGDQYMSLAITPKSATSKLVISVTLAWSPSVVSGACLALFQDATANALAAAYSYQSTAFGRDMLTLNYTMVSGTTSATTFKVRAGMDTAGTLTFNGSNTARIFGGVMASSIIIEEIGI